MSGFAGGMANYFEGQNNAEAAGQASRAQMNWGGNALSQANNIYQTNVAGFKPYEQTGDQAEQQLQAGMGQNGSLGRSFTMADFNQDPAYKFDVQQGLQAINNSNSVRGGALSGGTMKALSNYGQQQASNEFGAAANRFTQNQNQNFGQLSSLAGQGLNATQGQATLGQNFSNANTAQMNNMGNAQAGGILGQAAGQNQSIGGFFGAMGSLGTMAMGS